MNEFLKDDQSIESQFRSIVLFGRNVATYKFALAHSLLDLSQQDKTFVSLEELSPIFAKYMLEHVQSGKRQITSQSSQFINALHLYDEDKITWDQLMFVTERKGFNNVIDAFHNLFEGEITSPFYEKSVQGKKLGISLTDSIYLLNESLHFSNLANEIEGRWNLVESAWTERNPNLIVNYDIDSEELFFLKSMIAERYMNSHFRINLTPVRKSLNGYQKGKCFYCYRKISIDSGLEDTCDVDHFIPLSIQYSTDKDLTLNGVWNLVLCCKECNRGEENGKFARVPVRLLLDRLFKRNEYLINSNHPLKETILMITGNNSKMRKHFIEGIYNHAASIKKTTWEPKKCFDNAF